MIKGIAFGVALSACAIISIETVNSSDKKMKTRLCVHSHRKGIVILIQKVISKNAEDSTFR